MVATFDTPSKKRVRVSSQQMRLLDEGLTEAEQKKQAIAAAAEVLASNAAFVGRLSAKLGNFGKRQAIAAVRDEAMLWRRGVSAVNKFRQFDDLTDDEIHAVISLATHTVVMALAPGFGSVTNALARFALKRIFSAAVWRPIDFVSRRIARRFARQTETFEGMLAEANNALEFHSSAGAEAFILQNPPLRRAAAFSWWLGEGNRWAIAINRGGPSFQFVRQEGGEFFAGGQRLESLSEGVSLK